MADDSLVLHASKGARAVIRPEEVRLFRHPGAAPAQRP
jgi:hypothetical protein